MSALMGAPQPVHLPSLRRQVRLLVLLRAAEAAGLAPLRILRLHAFAYLSNVLAPVWDLRALDGKVLKRRGGPFYSYCVIYFCANFAGNCAHMPDIAAAEPGRLRKPLCGGGSRSSWGRDVAAAAAAPRGR